MPQLPALLQWIDAYGPFGLFLALAVGAIGVGVPIPVTALLLTLGALSGASNGPAMPALMVAGIAGIAAGHMVDYMVGRLSATVTARWLARATHAQRIMALVDAATSHRAGLAALIFASRFVLTPIASPVSLMAGMARMRALAYLALELAGASIYVVGYLALGRVAGPGLVHHGAWLAAFWIGVAVVTLLPTLLLRALYRPRRSRQVSDQPHNRHVSTRD